MLAETTLIPQSLGEFLLMVRTSPFSIRLTKEVRDKIEKLAETLRMKPSTLVALVIEDCTEEWVTNYSQEIFDKLNPNPKGGIQ